MAAKRKKDEGNGWAILIGIVLAIAAVLFVLSTIGHVLGLTPTFDELTDRPDGWVGEHYRGVFWGFVLTIVLLAAVAALAYVAVRHFESNAGESENLKRAAGVVGVLLLAILILPIGRRPGVETEAVRAEDPAAELVELDDGESEAEPQTVRVPAVVGRRAGKARGTLEEAGFRVSVRGGSEGADRSGCRVVRQSERGERELGTTVTIAVHCPAARPVAPPPEPEHVPEPACDPNYEGDCLKPDSPDYDCAGGSGDGPDYAGPVTVVGSDRFGLDRDGDGYACE